MSTPPEDLPSRLSFVGPARVGQPLEVRWIVAHPMESGTRVDAGGQRIARHLIDQVQVWLNDELLMELQPGTGMAANPYLAFWITVPAGGGSITVAWRDDRGRRGRIRQPLPPLA